MAKPLTRFTTSQAVMLELLSDGQPHSAIQGYRHALEALVRKGYARKHDVGLHAVTYTLDPGVTLVDHERRTA